ncbi:4-alpha-glucanotransferase [Alishewanella sp. SMS8]|uniref:4-alpha-glucanotransferase n=1 Tax=Alishewanella sp. SMS8 TaxID=2994676 RepID=UPI0027421CC7|nr:4-alpha-glucanotransferase [Alishewanella sp. SMS8]MDP5459061.1 4-alpha-glucanotransferase [Alishewanella sp. SMS8]
MEQLQQLADLAGLQQSYVHANGHPVTIAPEVQQAILNAMGFNLSNEQVIAEQVQQAIASRWQEPIAPVTVVTQGQPLQVRLQLDAQYASSLWQWQLNLEEGEVRQGEISLQPKDIIEQAVLAEQKMLAFMLQLPDDLPLGYHQLQLSDGHQHWQQQVIVSPSRCFQLHDSAILHKTMGPAIQLYAIRSARNWGIGDFLDLKNMVAPLAALGNDFIGLNPLHALYPMLPQDCSPYSPNSRLWLNTQYVALEHSAEFQHCSAAQQLVASAEFQQQLAACRAASDVDYAQVAALKAPVAKLLYQTFKTQELAKQSARAQAFQQFVQQGGASLKQTALFKVLQGTLFWQDHAMAAWQNFPPEYQNPQSDAVQQFAQEHAEQIHQQLYLQWLAQQQLAEVKAECQKQGMAIGLYCDVAVGTSRSSAESWAAPEDFLLDLSVGAPPDIMAPKGQNWGLLAYNPHTLRQKAYQPFIELIRANMRNAGALRLDHVMALLRLWCCPLGADATAGAYIGMPATALFAILALESQRNHCVVIGEDLGTVPVAISELMQRYQVLSYRVFMLEQKHGSYDYRDQTYPARALATVTTHDMPTLIGYWQEHDLALRHKLDLFPSAEVAANLQQLRKDEKQLLQQQLQLHEPDAAALVTACHLYAAATPAQLFAYQLEDLVLLDTPVNIPGTSTEYPNWRRKLPSNIEDILAQADVQQLLLKIKQARA